MTSLGLPSTQPDITTLERQARAFKRPDLPRVARLRRREHNDVRPWTADQSFGCVRDLGGAGSGPRARLQWVELVAVPGDWLVDADGHRLPFVVSHQRVDALWAAADVGGHEIDVRRYAPC